MLLVFGGWSRQKLIQNRFWSGSVYDSLNVTEGLISKYPGFEHDSYAFMISDPIVLSRLSEDLE